MTEALRMEAVVVDRFSAPLKALKDRLGDIKAPEHLKAMQERFAGVHQSVEKLTSAVRTGLTPALSGLGVAGLSVSGALAGAAQATRLFSETTNQLRHLSNETGASVNTLRTLEAIFNRVGVGADRTDGALSTFAENLRGIQRGTSKLWGELHDQDPGFANQIKSAKDYTTALGEALNWIRKIPNQQDAMAASKEIFGTSEFARLREMNDAEFQRTRKHVEQNQGLISPKAIENAKRYEDAISDLREKFTGLRDAVGTDVLPVMNQIVAGVTKFFEANQKPIQGGLMKFMNTVKAYDWAGLGNSIQTTFKNVNSFAEGLGGWRNVLIGIATVKVGSTIMSTATSIAALATSITRLNGAVGVIALPKLKEFLASLGVGAEGGAVAAGGGLAAFLAAIAKLIHYSHDAQKPGGGGGYAPATPETVDLDRDRLAAMKARREALDQQMAGTTARSKDPTSLGTILMPMKAERAELQNQIDLLEESLKKAAEPAPSGPNQDRLDALRAHLKETNTKIAVESQNSGRRGWSPAKTELLKTDREATEQQIAAIEQSLKDAQTRAMKEGAESGLRKATPEARRTISDWFASIFKSSVDGADAFGASGGTAKLIQASYGGGGFGGRMVIGRDGVMRPQGSNDVVGSARTASRRAERAFSGSVDQKGSSAGNLTKLIEEASKEAGIDPRIMQGIRAGESGHGSKYDKKDDAIESSWGPFQLNRRRGLGVQFEKETGLDVRNPDTIAAQARWVAQFLKKGGKLSNWMGYRGPRDADPRWGDSGYKPDSAASTAATGGAGGKTGGVNPVLQEMVRRASEQMGEHLSIESGLRSPEHNRAVGGAENSLHMRGYASDLKAEGHPKGDVKFWSQVNSAMKKVARSMDQPMRWGGSFGGAYKGDWNHFDLTKGGPSPEALAALASQDGGLARRAWPQDWRRASQGYKGMGVAPNGFLGGAQVNAHGKVEVTLNNFPSSVRASTQADGFFKSTKVNRGRTMPMPGEEV